MMYLSRHETKDYRGKAMPFFRYLYRVFRASGSTARLTILDRTPEGTWGPDGQEILCNFIEVEPYLLTD